MARAKLGVPKLSVEAAEKLYARIIDPVPKCRRLTCISRGHIEESMSDAAPVRKHEYLGARSTGLVYQHRSRARPAGNWERDNVRVLAGICTQSHYHVHPGQHECM
jgi:hypothetical protein